MRFRARFPRSPDGARRARKRLVVFATAWLRGEDLIDLELACGEALANCVEHGQGPLLTAGSCDSATLIIEIRQQGRSFTAPRAVVAPPQGAMRGYGFYIMHQVLDGIEFLEGGKGLRLLKKLRPRTGP